ncbi:MAG: IPTL-CTERM sorting domain-containing protein [Arhodomonas sp.]|nr:IPTL-CTERM sorting domain-containing protein [Arhodomonas sp.]
MWRNLKSPLIAITMAFSLALALPAQADDVLIVNGSSTTSEPGTTANITSALDTLLQSQGHTTTISDPVPGDISPYDQVWDIRFSDTSPITAGEETQFLDFLQAGGRMFVMGENNGFMTRNNSVLDLIDAAGGGSLSFIEPSSTQTVNPGLRSPNDIETVTYSAPGGTAGGGTTAGTGEFLSFDGTSGGTALGFPTGTLANATSGSLAVVFDVNFMADSGENGAEFLENLSLYVEAGGSVANGGPKAIPTLSEWAMILLSLIMAGLFALHMRNPRPSA